MISNMQKEKYIYRDEAQNLVSQGKISPSSVSS